MSYYLIAGFFILAVSVIIARYFSEKGLRELDTYEKMQLTESLSNYRLFSVFPPIFLMILFVIAVKVFRITVFFSIICFLSLLISYTMIFYVMVYKKLVRTGIPEKYRRNYIVSRTISTAGFIAFFAIVLAGVMKGA